MNWKFCDFFSVSASLIQGWCNKKANAKEKIPFDFKIQIFNQAIRWLALWCNISLNHWFYFLYNLFICERGRIMTHNLLTKHNTWRGTVCNTGSILGSGKGQKTGTLFLLIHLSLQNIFSWETRDLWHDLRTQKKGSIKHVWQKMKRIIQGTSHSC